MNRLTIAAAMMLSLLVAGGAAAQPTTRPDIETLIDTPLESVSFENLTLPEAIATVGDKAHVNLVADWASLNYRADINSQKIQGRYRYLTVKQLIAIAFITAAAEPPRLVVHDNVVNVIGPTHVELKIFRIGPHLAKRIDDAEKAAAAAAAAAAANSGQFGGGLFGGGYSTDYEGLMKTLKDQAPPDTWSGGGGTGSINILLDRIIIRQTPENLQKIGTLLERLEADVAK